jgi:hypothetical protein
MGWRGALKRACYGDNVNVVLNLRYRKHRLCALSGRQGAINEKCFSHPRERSFLQPSMKGSSMGTIIPFLRNGASLRDSVFEPHDIKAMSIALDDVCAALKLRDGSAKEVIAARIIDLARRGERSPTRLRDRVLHEAGLAEYAGIGKARTARAPKQPPPPGADI